MNAPRKFLLESRHLAVEGLLSKDSTTHHNHPSYEAFSGLVSYWKTQNAKGGFCNPPAKEASPEQRVRPLKQLVSKLAKENGFLKNPYRETIN